MISGLVEYVLYIFLLMLVGFGFGFFAGVGWTKRHLESQISGIFDFNFEPGQSKDEHPLFGGSKEVEE